MQDRPPTHYEFQSEGVRDAYLSHLEDNGLLDFYDDSDSGSIGGLEWYER